MAAQHKAEDAAERLRRIDQARRCWSEAGPVTGSLAQRYLRARGITCDLPPTLRFHPECWHGPTARKVPAMVSAVAIGQKLVGVHRTYLAEPGVKAFDNAKLMLGCCAGGAVRLTPPARSLVVAEGIETGLSLVQGIDRPVEVWSTLSTSGMAGLILPSDRDEIVIGPDGDEPGRKAAAMLADRGGAAGLSVRIMRCPSGRDFNDMLMEVVR